MKTFVPDNDPSSRMKLLAAFLLGILAIAILVLLGLVRIEIAQPTRAPLNSPPAPTKAVSPSAKTNEF